MVSFLRSTSLISPDRATLYPRLLLAVLVVLSCVWILLADGLVDRAGSPLGTDFISFYAASAVALGGSPPDAWNPAVHGPAQIAVLGRDLGYWAFFYPPPFLLLCLPLALMPYGVALCLWIAGSSAALIAVLRRFAGRHVGWTVLAAFPALWLNAGHGQNGALTTALFGAAFLALPRRPVLCGLAIACLVIKPQIGLALPFALAAAGAWTAVVAAGVGVAALGALASLVLSPEVWPAFFAAGRLATMTLEQNLVGYEKMPTLFAAVSYWGAPAPLAYAAQAVLALAVVGALVFTIRRHRPEAMALGAAAAAATPLISPFMLDYDLCLTGLPLAWLVARGITAGFRPYEQALSLAVFVFPLVGRALGTIGLTIGPALLAGLFILVLVRIARGDRA